MAACGSSSDEKATSAGGKKDVRFSIIGLCKADPTGNAINTSIVEQAEALGWKVDYQNVNPCGSVPAANSLLKVDALKRSSIILTFAFDPASLSAGLAQTQKAKIPVMAFAGAKLAPGITWASDLGYNADMGKLIEADFGGAGQAAGKILNLTFHGATPGVGRDRLMQDVAKRNPGLELTNKEITFPGSVNSARDFTVAWLAANPRKPGVRYGIHAIFDDAARGAVAALQRAHRKDVKVYSYDATPAGLNLVRKGWIRADSQSPRVAQAKQIVAAAQKILDGSFGKPRVEPAAHFIITTDNVKQYYEDHPKAFTTGE